MLQTGDNGPNVKSYGLVNFWSGLAKWLKEKLAVNNFEFETANYCMKHGDGPAGNFYVRQRERERERLC